MVGSVQPDRGGNILQIMRILNLQGITLQNPLSNSHPRAFLLLLHFYTFHFYTLPNNLFLWKNSRSKSVCFASKGSNIYFPSIHCNIFIFYAKQTKLNVNSLFLKFPPFQWRHAYSLTPYASWTMWSFCPCWTAVPSEINLKVLFMPDV